MIIQCDQCSAKFRLDDNKVTESGVKVRCKRCRNIFLVKQEPTQEEPDLDALLGFPPVTAPSPAVSPQETAPTPEPAPFVTAPEPSEDDSSLFFLQVDQTLAAPPEELRYLPRDTADEFTVSAEETDSIPPRLEDDFGFSFADEPLVEAPANSSPPPEPAAEAPAPEAGWDEFEVEIPPPEPVFTDEPAESEAGAPPVVVAEVKPEEKLDAPSWDGFDSFEIELPENVGLPAEPPEQEPVTDEPVRSPALTPTAEPVAEEASDFFGWPPEINGAAPASSAFSPDSIATVGEELPPSSPAEGFTFSSPPEATPVIPAVSEASVITGAQDSPLPPTPVPGDNVKGDAIIFDDVDAPSSASRRQGPSLIAIVGMVLAALVVMIVGGGGALYLLKGPEAFEKVGLGSVSRLLGLETTGQGRILVQTIQGSYVNNREAGELFVIRGETVNSYKTPRAGIKVRGLIYNAAGTVILQKSTFCGNPLSQEQLATLPMGKIEEAMNNRLGESYANIGVPPGKSVPFLIVFSGLPKDAADFGVEFVESQAAGQ